MTRFALLAVVVAALFAAPDAEAQRRQRAFAEQGDLALVAVARGLDVVRLTPLDSGVGLRYRVTDQTVLGASLGLSLADRDEDASRDVTDNSEFSDETGNSSTRLRVSMWLEQHLGRGRGPISPFVGAGLRLATSDDGTRVERHLGAGCSAGAVCSSVIENERASVAVGAALLLGAEVKLARGVTLGAAYTLGAEYRTDEQTTTVTDRRDGAPDFVDRRIQDARTVSLGTGLTELALSIYL